MIKTIFFDLDQTILDFRKSERSALSQMLTHFGIEPDDEKLDLYSKINLSQWKLLEQKKLTLAQLKVSRYRIFLDRIGARDVSPEDATKYYEHALCRGYFTIPGAVGVLETLYKKYDLYIASNGTPNVQHSRIEGSGIAKYFKDIFISHELGASKPDKAFFDICFSRIDGFDTETALMIGDSLTSDIAGGINAGIKTLWYNPAHIAPDNGIKPDFEAHSLEEIPGIVSKI